MKNYFFNLKFVSGKLLLALLVTSLNCALLSAEQKPAGNLLSFSEGKTTFDFPAMGGTLMKESGISPAIPSPVANEKKTGTWFPNPNPSKYFIGHSAIPLEKGSGYFQNTWIFVNSAGFAITNNISISGGVEIISLLARGEGPYAFFLNPKISFSIGENFYAGGNILYLNTLRTIDKFGGLATLNGFFTYGNDNNNITAGAGWGFADGQFSSLPVITVSGMVRVSGRIAFVTENWILPVGGDEGKDLYGMFSYGIRFLGEKNSIDLGFMNNRDLSQTLILGIPLLNFVINF